MTDLIDYSGDFDPEFSHEKLSKQTLLKLRETYADYIRAIDGFWYLVVKEKWGNDVALECDIAVWEKAMMFELKSFSEVLNIRGDDVATVLKYLQCNPWWAFTEYQIEILDKNLAIITEHTCRTLFALEREGKGREELQCQQVCPRIQGLRATFFNPSINFNLIKAPPRESGDDICCQWELKLES